jgi:putative tricarboxylic transport membrane protein
MAVLGYILHRLGWPIVTLVIGLVLGDILEERLRESLRMSGGSLMIFVDRPISLGLIISALLIVVIPLVIDYRRKRKEREAPEDLD